MKKKLILGLLCGCMVFGSSSVWASSVDGSSIATEQQTVVGESTTGETDAEEASSDEETGDEVNSGEEQGIYSFDVDEALSEDAEEISDNLDDGIAAYNSDADGSNEVESAKQNGWVDEADGRHYYEDGVEVVNRYVHDNDKWYWMDKNGVMSTGVTLIGNRYYYFDKNGVESYATGWIQDENGWYFALEDRTLLCNQWLQRPSGWYWLGSDCRMATGMTNVKGKTYYMNETGTMLTGWVQLGSDYYFFNPDGDMLHGWLRRPSGWYYLNDETGKMDIGWKQVKGNWYYLHPGTGEALHDWQLINGSWYYLSNTIEDCSMKTGWIKSKGTWYYCMPEGEWKSLNVAVVGKNDGNSQVCAAAMQKLGMNPTVVTRNYNPSNYDAMIIPGGGDIDPSRYGEANKSSKDIDNALDDYQLKAINATWEAGKPMLGICKGIQLLNVYFGGTLNQNIYGHMGVWHDVYTTSRSNWCADLSYDGRVLSYHHQSIKKVASVFTVDLKAPDGTVEAVHSTVGKVYGVQFHPEQMNNELGTNYLKRIMEKFIF